MTRSSFYELPLVKRGSLLDEEASDQPPSHDHFQEKSEINLQKSCSMEAPNQEETEENDAVEDNQEENNETEGFLWRIMKEVRLRSAQKDQKRIQRRNQIQRLHQLLEKYKQELSAETLDSIQAINMSMQNETKRREKMKLKIGKLVRNGTARDHVDAYRCVQLLKLRRIHLEQSKNLLRQQVLETRKLEIEWLLGLSSQYLAQDDEEKAEDLPSSHIMGLLQLEPEDPFFISPTQLLQVHPETKQLDFQLKHGHISLERAKEHLEEQKHIRRTSFILKSSKSFSSASPLDPRNPNLPSIGASLPGATTCTGSSSASTGPSGSFRLLRSSSAAFFLNRGPNPGDSARRQELINTLTKMFQLKSTISTRLDTSQYQLYTRHLNTCRRLLSDQRTRSGYLLQSFYEKLEREVTTNVQLNYQIDNNNSASSNGTTNSFFLPSLHELVKKKKEKIVAMIDQSCLPPSVCITAFTRFLYRLVMSEYQLEEFCNSKTSTTTVKEFQYVLEESVHHLVFTKLSKFCMSYFTGDSQRWYFTLLHWQHSLDEYKERPLEAVGFDNKALLDRIASKGSDFLYKTQQVLSQIQYEITPKGVLECIMRMMTQLHQEFMDLWEETEKGKSFINADLLIPLLVLVLVQRRRVETTSSWNVVPLRLALVESFQTTCFYSETGEEAYYLTCLRAAMEFIIKSSSCGETTCSICLEEINMIELKIIDNSHSSSSQNGEEIEQAIQALSDWISKQNMAREENILLENTWMMS